MKHLLAFVVMGSSAVFAVPIPGLNNTGAGLGDGANDPFYAIISPAQQAVVVNAANIPGTYIPNSAASRWVWQSANGQPTNVTRTFRTTFLIAAGFDPSTATITGRWAVDNFGDDILLNGVSTTQTAPGFGSWTAFALNSGFVSGLNTIDFVARDVGVISGFRAEFLDSNIRRLPGGQVPEPGTWLLAGVGLVALGLSRRYRSAKK